MQYCSLPHQILLLSPITSTTGFHFYFGSITSFFLDLFLHWSPVAYWAPYWPGEFLFQYPIILPFHTVHGVLKARILKWFAIPYSSGRHPADLSTMTCPSWVAPWAWLSFIELDKAVVLVWLDWLVLWAYGFSVSDALLQHLPSYLGFSYLRCGISLQGCSSKVQPLLLTLDEGCLLTATRPDLERGVAPLSPPVPTQPLLLGMANHFSILALRTPWTVWKGKMIGYWKRNSPGW